MANIKEISSTSAAEGGSLEFLCFHWLLWNGAATLENSLGASYKTKPKLGNRPAPGYLTQKAKADGQQKPELECLQQLQSQFLRTGEQTNWCFHTMDSSSAVRTNTFLMHTATWLTLQGVALKKAASSRSLHPVKRHPHDVLEKTKPQEQRTDQWLLLLIIILLYFYEICFFIFCSNCMFLDFVINAISA